MNSVTNHEIQFICVTVSFERLFHSGYDSQALPVDAGLFIYGEKKCQLSKNIRIRVERAKVQTFCYGHKKGGSTCWLSVKNYYFVVVG